MELNTWGSISSILGFVITIFGFGFTIYKVLKVKKAAESAEFAAKSMYDGIRQLDTLSDLSSVLETMTEIKRLQREKSWKVVQDRYSSARKKLILVKSTHPNLSDQHKRKLQSAIQYLSDLEATTEKGLANPEFLPEFLSLNTLISEQIDYLTEVIAELKKQMFDTN